ncbi:hypothetical protein D9758_003671 [Tetrapyrgos nigripes]|uniref:Uncharacterized protein n=1 Tax=Tetrapyrgos nigripes TaxID=182062 RepID=A0A8H5GM25_9AGAR|nr:hypothetical protein D9758_003671 [Tetrapyrgos nigripes]
MTDIYFTTKDGINYTRRLHGRERMSAANTTYAHGFGQIVALGEVELKSPLTREQLAPYVKAAWTHLRFLVPWMAIRTSDMTPNPRDNAFLYSYAVPVNQEQVDAWLEETVIWRSEELPFADWESLLRITHWKPGDNRCAFELHVAALPDGHWMMGLTAPHWVTDGRGKFPVIDQYYKCLQAAFDGSSKPVDTIAWGEEITRLPPTGVQVLPAAGALPETMDPPQGQFTRLMRQPREVDLSTDNITRCIVLTKEQTDAFNLACKQHRCSITAAINSVFILADIETELRIAADAKGEVWERVLESFHQSEFFTVAVNVSDLVGPAIKLSEDYLINTFQRHFVYPLFAKVCQPCGVGGLINCGFPTYHNMKEIRACLQVTPDGCITKNYGTKTFWNGLVVDVRKVLKEGIRTKASPRWYHQLSNNVEAASANVTSFQMAWPGVMASSLGSLQKLSWFCQFRPSVAVSDPDTAFSINQWRFGIRATGALAIVINTWEYDGILSLNLQGSKRWQTEKAWDYFTVAVSDGFERITSTKATL